MGTMGVSDQDTSATRNMLFLTVAVLVLLSTLSNVRSIDDLGPQTGFPITPRMYPISSNSYKIFEPASELNTPTNDVSNNRSLAHNNEPGAVDSDTQTQRETPSTATIANDDQEPQKGIVESITGIRLLGL